MEPELLKWMETALGIGSPKRQILKHHAYIHILTHSHVHTQIGTETHIQNYLQDYLDITYPLKTPKIRFSTKKDPQMINVIKYIQGHELPYTLLI